MNRVPIAALSLLLFAGLPEGARGAARTWDGSASSDWFDADNWDPAGIPAAGDEVTIGSGTALLTADTPALASLSLTGTLVFSNWNTTLSAAEVTVGVGGVMTCAGPFTDTQMSNNVVVVCSNLTILANGKILADRKGYSSGLTGGSKGYGPGAGKTSSGGYGGVGAGDGITYGSCAAPLAPGSGGYSGHTTYRQGDGGGAVNLSALCAVTVNGSITADGGPNAGWGSLAGSGGAVFITCRTIAGNGTVSAAGGANGGGGGRIAVLYDPSAQAAEPVPSLRFSATTTGPDLWGDIGTLYFPDNRLLAETIRHSGQWSVPGFTAWSPAALTVDNSWIGFRASGFQLAAAGDVVVNGGGARLELGGNRVVYTNAAQSSGYRYTFSEPDRPSLACGGSLILTNGGRLTVYAGPTNAASPAYGALIAVTNDLYVGNGSWVVPVSHWTNGGSVRFSMNRLTVWTNGGFNATGAGYRGGGTGERGYGPGGGGLQGGGSHGGLGGEGCGSLAYGSAENPLAPGSGGGGYYSDAVYNACGMPGGGLVWIEARDRITLFGSILADGVAAGNYPGSGSGGAVSLMCRTLAGSPGGLVRANGGNRGWTTRGGGGGGRIAVRYQGADQAAVGPTGIRFSAAGADNGADLADMGTLYFTDDALLATELAWSGSVVIPGFTTWTPDSLTLKDGWLGFRAPGFHLDVAGDLLVSGAAARLHLGGGAVRETVGGTDRFYYSDPVGPALTCGGNLVLTNGAKLAVYCAATNGLADSHGAQITVAGDIRLSSANCWIYPHSHPTNGGSLYVRTRNLFVETLASGFDASQRGFACGGASRRDGFGPGAGTGTTSAGAGYGGTGGYYPTYGGAAYGCSNAPALPGSGGAANGGAGGGLIWIDAAREISLQGALLANGQNAYGGTGAGSGGGIYLRCRLFRNAPGVPIEARGGNQAWGVREGAGGGRVAIWRTRDFSAGAPAVTVANGSGSGTPGTVVWGVVPDPGTVLLMR